MMIEHDDFMDRNLSLAIPSQKRRAGDARVWESQGSLFHFHSTAGAITIPTKNLSICHGEQGNNRLRSAPLPCSLGFQNHATVKKIFDEEN